MRNLLSVILLSFGLMVLSEDIPPYESEQYYFDSYCKVEDTISILCKPTPDTISDINLLINAMILVESEGNDSAYNKSEEAVGCLQIRPIMLAECNRILKLQNSNISYNLIDRWDRNKSIQIFNIINKHHNINATYEEIARFWNGGPKWANKSATKKYWEKVYVKLDEQYKKDEHSINRFSEI